MQDWPSFFFTGTTVLPALMVVIDPNAFEFAIVVFVSLLAAGIFASQRDDSSVQGMESEHQSGEEQD